MATGSELFWKQGREHDVMNCQMDPSWHCHNFLNSRRGDANQLEEKLSLQYMTNIFFLPQQ